MKQFHAKLWEPGEYRYEGAYGFEPEIYAYLHEDDRERPCMIVAPGGGYAALSPSESEVVAMDFFERGYQAFVCVYTVNPVGWVPLKMQALKDLSRAVRWVRSQAGEFHVNPSKVAICGFSAAERRECAADLPFPLRKQLLPLLARFFHKKGEKPPQFSRPTVCVQKYSTFRAM